MNNTPILDFIPDLHKLNTRQLRQLARVQNIGSAPWRATARKDELMDAVKHGACTTQIYRYELVKAEALELQEHNPHMSGPEEVVAFGRALQLDRKEQEHLYAILLDTKNRVKGYSLVSVGLIDRTQASAREVFRTAIYLGASSLILLHNHPSGDPTPSAADIACSKELSAAGKIIGITLTDHVVLGRSCPGRKPYFSFRENDLL